MDSQAVFLFTNQIVLVNDQKYGVDGWLSHLLQAHGQTGVVSKHYRNNPEAALPEKRRAVELFDRALAKALGEDKGTGNTLPISRWKKNIPDSKS